MVVIGLQILGWVAFVVGTLLAGRRLRQHPDRATAESLSRVVQGLFFVGLNLPWAIAIFYPGLTNYDALLGVPPLPLRPLTLAGGAVLLLAGLYLEIASARALRRLGHGANAFRLTTALVTDDIYQRTRHPMALGWYLFCLGVALLAGSTTITLVVLFAIIPAHLLYLVYFEQYEVQLRLGQAYVDYRQNVPFLFPRPGG